jgi:hypothetical protein
MIKKHRRTIPCANCKINLTAKPSVLCRACYKIKEVRLQYCKPTSYHVGGLYVSQYGNVDCQVEPTDFPPGSEDKIEVMRRRAEVLAPLCHPLDAGSKEKIPPPSAARRLRRLSDKMVEQNQTDRRELWREAYYRRKAGD